MSDDGGNWEVYLTRIEDDVASIMLDMAAPHERKLADWPHLFLVRVPLLNPGEGGLHQEEENESLYAIEDELSRAADEHGAIYVGRMTIKGNREFAYYAPEAMKMEQALQQAMAGFTRYTGYELVHVKEPEWGYYGNLLYPSPLEMQMIMNRHVIHNLQKSGDSLTTPRNVDHGLYFATAKGRDAFLAEVQELGFKVQVSRDSRDEEDGPPDDEHPFFVELGLEQPADPESIDEVVLDLCVRADKHGGYFDGWGCPVVTA